jgi:hypothetical protein
VRISRPEGFSSRMALILARQEIPKVCSCGIIFREMDRGVPPLKWNIGEVLPAFIEKSNISVKLYLYLPFVPATCLSIMITLL